MSETARLSTSLTERPICIPIDLWAQTYRTAQSQRGRYARVALCCCLLQLVDGGVTYLGLQVGFSEINHLQLWLFARLGVGSALVLTKSFACLLAAASWHGGHYRAVDGLRLVYMGVVALPFVTFLVQLV